MSDRTAVILSTCALLAFLGCHAAHDSAPVSARHPTPNTDPSRCLAYCHRVGMKVVQFDGADPWSHGPSRGCVCGEAP